MGERKGKSQITYRSSSKLIKTNHRIKFTKLRTLKKKDQLKERKPGRFNVTIAENGDM